MRIFILTLSIIALLGLANAMNLDTEDIVDEMLNATDFDDSTHKLQGDLEGSIHFKYGDYEYMYFANIALSWGDAQRYCQRWHGDLASINSKAENTFIFNKLKGQKNPWIGYIESQAMLDTWQWVDGSGGYTNWQSGEPNHAHGPGSEICSEFYTKYGTWNDQDCTDGLRPLCKRINPL